MTSTEETYFKTRKLSIYQKLLALIITPINGLIVLGFGWQAYATITGRPGYRGDVHIYYNLSAGQFAIYNLMVGIFAISIFCFLTIYFWKKNSEKLIITFWAFTFFIAFIIISELYLQIRFIPKG